MPSATFSEAAKVLGFKSRSTLYRLRDQGDLADYLRPPASPGGAQLLELTPRNLPPLREAVARLIRPQANNPERHRRPRTDARWGVVAGRLTEALAGCGGLSLCDAEAEAIAAALPGAVSEGFGFDGLELLRVALADRGCWLAGPGTPTNPEAEAEWWSERGRWEPGQDLDDGPFWENVGPITGGMMGPPFEGMSGGTACELHHQLMEAIRAVELGARWDARKWDTESARSLLDDEEVAAGECPNSLPELQRLNDRGLLPPDLQAQLDAALAAYAAKGEAVIGPPV